MQKKHLLIPLITTIFLSTLTYHLSPIHAASPSPESSASAKPKSSPVSSPGAAIDDAVAEENVIKRLQEYKMASASPSPLVIAYIGTVKDVIKDTIIIEDKDGKKDIKIEDSTSIFRSPGNAAIKAENIRIDDYIIAIGYPGDTDMLIGKRLLVSADPIKPPAKTTGIGTITKISKTSLTLKLADKDQSIITTPKTIYKSAVGTIEATDLSVGDTLIYTATQDSQEDLTATVIMRIQTASIGE